MYGTNDREPSGVGLNPTDVDYPGTYKDNMQRIITEIQSAGKVVALAKLPVVLNGQGIDPQRDVGIQEYNQVIDELVAANNITLTPPNLYSYFASHYSTEFADWVHPNGLGYQSMAQLWFQALYP
jgi:lysophospholipase L1-like esterase